MNELMKVANDRLNPINELVESNKVLQEMVMNLSDRVSTLTELVGDLYTKHGQTVGVLHDVKKETKSLGEKLWHFKNKFSEWWEFKKLKRRIKKKKKYERYSV